MGIIFYLKYSKTSQFLKKERITSPFLSILSLFIATATFSFLARLFYFFLNLFIYR